MKTRLNAFTALALVVFLAGSSVKWLVAQGAPAAVEVDIPFQKFVLPNGLTVVVHEDHKAPIVAVNVWYHVGSKNEKPGKSGFAHLFEHLMFNGSENFNNDYFPGHGENWGHRFERNHERRPDELFSERSQVRSGCCALDGVGSDGASAGCHRQGKARRAAWRCAERESARVRTNPMVWRTNWPPSPPIQPAIPIPGL